ncbi:MAG: hypothetical protein V2I97_19070 [Desulfococcaceae bacterium]|jgi:hypothetical protein|nr:hypothetical protein [Desulfococcaceae bacterium]
MSTFNVFINSYQQAENKLTYNFLCLIEHMPQQKEGRGSNPLKKTPSLTPPAGGGEYSDQGIWPTTKSFYKADENPFQ